jgi:predicted N-acetyltransferase YhbS
LPEGVTLRAATPADAAAVTAVARAAKAHWGYPPAWMEAWDGELTMTPEYLERHRAWCAVVSGDVVGFCALEEQGESWQLEYLWVSPGHHGSGIGRALVQAARAEAARVRPAEIRVVSDPHALPFYERLGARRVGSLPAPMPGAPERALPVLLLS